MPAAVEMPAPVSTATTPAAATIALAAISLPCLADDLPHQLTKELIETEHAHGKA